VSDQRVRGELPTNSLDDDGTGIASWNALTRRTRAIAAPSHTIVLVIKPSGKAGRFLGYISDELIVTSRQPFLDGARALFARGHDPSTPYNMRHASSDVLSFVTTTIGHAAELSVVDAAQGTRFRKFVPSNVSDERLSQSGIVVTAGPRNARLNRNGASALRQPILNSAELMENCYC
jgi:hypothetical protein